MSHKMKLNGPEFRLTGSSNLAVILNAPRSCGIMFVSQFGVCSGTFCAQNCFFFFTAFMYFKSFSLLTLVCIILTLSAEAKNNLPRCGQ